MATDPRKAATVDPDFELFFRDLGEAVRLVEMDYSKAIEIEKGSRKASVFYDPDLNSVTVQITGVEPKQPTMLVP